MRDGLDIRPLASFATQAWRNGGGTTRPLAEDADGAWRISLASIERDGPYSRFPGMTRLSLVMQGTGITLRDEAVQCHLRPGLVAEYDGGPAWQATLHHGPVMALNAMALRGRVRARVLPLTEAANVPPGCFALVLTMAGHCVARIPDTGRELTLEAAHVMTRDEHGPALHLAPGDGASAALVIIEKDAARH